MPKPKPRIVRLQCAKTGRTFEHVITGSGRFPLYHPDVRAAIKQEQADEARARYRRRIKTALTKMKSYRPKPPKPQTRGQRIKALIAQTQRCIAAKEKNA